MTDMRRGFDGLARQAQEALQLDPFSGHLFVFRGRRGNLLKCLFWDTRAWCSTPSGWSAAGSHWPQARDGSVKLYAIEKRINGKPPDRRLWIRRVEVLPLLDDLGVWLEATRTRLSGRSDITSAIRYALSRWTALVRYARDGTIAIDNNLVERVLQPMALGRKNWLFA